VSAVLRAAVSGLVRGPRTTGLRSQPGVTSGAGAFTHGSRFHAGRLGARWAQVSGSKSSIWGPSMNCY
jgi:hypothetical protein